MTLQLRMILLIVSLILFMESLDSTIINTAIPAMSISLQVNPIDLKVALISYFLSLSIFIPISGWVADKVGIKKVFIASLFVFTLSSLWCGFAHNLIELIIARFVQGLGAALGLPVGRLIIVRSFERHHLIKTMGRVAMIAAMGMMLGPVLGGLITHFISWQWIFWINIPIGIITIALAYFWLVEVKPTSVHALDKLGFILFGGALAGFTFGFSAISDSTGDALQAILVILTALVLLIFYFYHSRHRRYPIVQLSLLNFRTFKISVIGNLLSRLGFGGVPFLIPLLLQIGIGYSAQLSGLLLAPIALGVLLIKPVAVTLIRYFGYRRLLFLNTLLLSFSLWTFIFINTHTSLLIICLFTFLYGFIVSLQYSGMNSLAYVDIETEQLSSAISMMSTLQQLVQGIGVAICAILLRIFSEKLQLDLVLSINAFRYTFGFLGLLTFFSAFVFLKLKDNDGKNMFIGNEC